MLRAFISLIIAISLFLAPYVHINADAALSQGADRVSAVSAMNDGINLDQGKRVTAGLHCCFEHSSSIPFDLTEVSATTTTSMPHARDDAIRASAVIAPPIKPPYV